MMDVLIFILILLALITIWFLIMYWGLKPFYNYFKPKIDSISERTEKIEELEKRVELLEIKIENE